MTLDQVRTGGRARISGFADTGPHIQRLLELGLLQGTEVEVVRRAPAGDPIELRVLGYALALRRAEARCIRVEPLS